MFVNTREQGDIGELSAMQWLVSKGARIALPVGHSPDWDLLVEWHEHLYRIQVKTSTYHRNDRWIVAICTRGGNQSWNKLSKPFSASRCDFLFVHVGGGRRWMIPAASVEAAHAIALGSKKYAIFEVEPGEPLPARTRLNRTA
jgi:hypothetical protein